MDSLKAGAINRSLTDCEIVKHFIDSYKKHPSIKLIEENLSQKGSFHFVNASVGNFHKTIQNINYNKVTGPYKIPPKLVI